MKIRSRLALTVALLAAISLPAFALSVGDQAPNFAGKDTHGQAVHLSQYRGKYVVLEWTNSGCPFTRKHYDTGNMQRLQREWRARGVVWITILSSAPGQEGYKTAPEENAYMAKMHADPTEAILDPAGNIGHLYDAKTTPDMYIINPEGKLIYEGAIDNRPTTDHADVKGADNYVSDALTEALAGHAVKVDYERPYGCSVKYAGE